MNIRRSIIIRSLALIVCAAAVLSLVPFAVGAESGREAVDPTAYYGRNALASMDNSFALLNAYDSIATAVEVLAPKVTVYDGHHPITLDELEIVMDAYRRDYVQHFWLSNGYSYSFNADTVIEITPVYIMDRTQANLLKNTFDSAVERILACVTPEMSDFEVELYFHNYIIENTDYAESELCRTAYGALVEGVAVCEGYSEAFQYLCMAAGIESFTAIGDADGGHEWSYVKLDGDWYHVDVTWDDQQGISYLYFNRSTATIRHDREINATGFALPTCNRETKFYYNVMPGKLTEYSVDAVAALFDGDLTAHVYDESGVDALMNWLANNIAGIASKLGVNGSFRYSRSVSGNEVVVSIFPESSPTTGVELDTQSVELSPGGTYALTVTVLPTFADDKTFSCESDDDGVATVDASGVITAVGEGETTVTVTTTDGGFTAQCAVKVTAAAPPDPPEPPEPPEPPAPQPGDVDGDGKVNAGDILKIMKHLTGWTAENDPALVGFDETAADFNGDGKLNDRDVVLIMIAIVNGEI